MKFHASTPSEAAVAPKCPQLVVKTKYIDTLIKVLLTY